MNPAHIEKIGEALYGPWWRRPLSQELGISARTLYRYSGGEWKLPSNMEPRLREVMLKRLRGIHDLIEMLDGSLTTGEKHED